MKYLETISNEEAELRFSLENLTSDGISAVRVYVGADGNTGWIQSMLNGKYYTFCCCEEYYGSNLSEAEELLRTEHFDEPSINELLEAYRNFAIAARELSEAIGETDNESSDCADCFPFNEDFEEVVSRIQHWSTARIDSLGES